MTRFGSRPWSPRSALSAVIFVICFVIAFSIWHPLVQVSPSTFTFDVQHPFTRPQEPVIAPPSTGFIDLNQHPDLPLASYNPYPAYNSLEWRSRWRGKYHECEGPRGPNGNALELLQARSVSNSVPNPNPLVGSYEEMGLDNSHCFDREGRLSAYGLGDGIEGEAGAVDWQNVDWGTLQDRCIDLNIERYDQEHGKTAVSPFRIPGKKDDQDRDGTVVSPFQEPEGLLKDKLHSRSYFNREYSTRKAVLVRSWDSKKYNKEVTQHIRSMITELSLHTGGEYAVYLIVEIKDSKMHIHNSTKAYAAALHDAVPQEFRNISLLFNQPMLDAWYPDIPAGGQIWHMNQPVQLFSLFNPQFTHVWDFELDVRYTANWYDLLSRSTDWARAQPRKYQWERAAKYYLQSRYGTYANYTDSIAAAAHPIGGIWGPVLNPAVPHPSIATAPKDTNDWTWGVGEDADDIAPAPIIDIQHTDLFENNTNTGFPDDPPRRALLTTPVKGLSRRLLRAMHDAQVAGLDMRSELFAHTIALLHGFKVAVVPIPVFSGNDTVEVAGQLEDAWAGTTPTQLPDKFVWLQGLGGFTTFWWKVYEVPHYPRNLFRRWYGIDKKDGKGGREERLCLPGMLLHPVKDVEKKN